MDNLKKWPYPTEIFPARLPLHTIALAWLGAALATAAFAFAGDSLALPLVLGSFGASCLLVFAYPKSPFAQPRNVIGGHFTATLIGLVFMALFGVHWWSMALAVGTAVALMLLLRVPQSACWIESFDCNDFACGMVVFVDADIIRLFDSGGGGFVV